MKTLLFNYRILFTVMITGLFMTNVDVAFGQCNLCGGTATGTGSVAIGPTAFAGTSTTEYGYAFGSAAHAKGENSVAIGIGVGTDSTSEFNLTIGNRGAANFTNTIDFSIMLGTKLSGTVPTMYLEDPDLSSQSFGNVGIGTVAPESRLHVYDTARVGVASTANGSLVFNGSSNANTVSINSGVTTASYDLYLPTATGSDGDLLGLTGTAGQLEWFSPSTITDAWLLGGNTGIGATDYLGTINSADLKIITANSEKMRIEVGGDVGIGTDDPDGILHLYNGASTTNLVLEKDAGTSAYLRFHNASTTGAYIGFDNSEDLRIFNEENGRHIRFRLKVGGSTEEVMRMNGGNGYVGIGTPSPDAKLHVFETDTSTAERLAEFTVGDAGDDHLLIKNRTTSNTEYAPMIQSIVESQTSLPALTIDAQTDATGDVGTTPMMEFSVRVNNNSNIATRPLFEWKNRTSSQMLMDANGNLGIGTASPSSKLTIAGNISPSSSNTHNLGTSTSDRWNTIYYSTLVQGSDDRIKQNINSLEYGLNELLQLEPISYELIPPVDSMGQIIEEAIIGEQFGLSAQSLQNVLPQLVHEDGDSMNLLGVRYVELIPLLINSIQEQNELIQNLADELAELRAEVTSCCGGAEPAMRMGNYSENDEFEEVILFRNDPNPFSAWTDIQYEVASDKGLSLLFTDVSGRIVKRIALENTKGVVRVYGTDLGTGQYFYSLLSGSSIVRTERMIITN